MSEFLRGAMQRAAAGEPPVSDAWSRFQSRKTRMQRARGAAVFFTTVVAAFALVVNLPGGGGDNVLPGGGSGTEDPQPQDPSLKRYLEPEVGYQVHFPAAWHARGVKAQYAELFPLDDRTTETSPMSSITERDDGGRTVRVEKPNGFFVEITTTVVRRGDRAPSAIRAELMDELDAAGASIARTPMKVGGKDATSFGVVFPAEPEGRAPAYWCGRCRLAEYHIDRWKGSYAVSIRILAPDADSFERYFPRAAGIVESFASYAPPDPEDSPTRL
ncbi:MAG TPA: hypothetical protein VM600_02335 [Actinomycetota bacterium]|nr:hypothetical protein [Actinomycetota bacterium]